MRNEQRIDRILKLIGKIWKKYPDLRLGQMLGNYTSLGSKKTNIHEIEDDEIERELIEANEKLGISVSKAAKNKALVDRLWKIKNEGTFYPLDEVMKLLDNSVSVEKKVEIAIKNSNNSLVKISEIEDVLGNNLSTKQINDALNTLDKKNKILVGKRGILWIENKGTKA